MEKIPSIKEIKKSVWKFHKLSLEPQIHMRIFPPYIVWFLLHFNITATQVTILWVLLAVLSSFMFLWFNSAIYLVAAALLLFAYQLDYVDGSIARFKKQFSRKGTLIDFIGTWVMSLLPPAFISLAYFFNTGKLWILIAGIALLIGYAMKELMPLKEFILYNKSGAQELESANKQGLFFVFYRNVRRFLLLEFFFEALFIACFFGIPEYFVLYYAIMFNILWIGKFVYIIVKKDEIFNKPEADY